MIHTIGASYLWAIYSLNIADTSKMTLNMALTTYSVSLLPGQLALVCAVSVLAFVIRKMLFY